MSIRETLVELILFGGMADNNVSIINKAFKEFANGVMREEMTKQISLHCLNLLISAIRNRMSLSHRIGHDYTGNLINSIVVVLYQDGEIADIWTAGEAGQVRKPKFRKMSARKKMYVYSNDYSNSSSRYRAEIPTNRGVADEDIQNFLSTNTPSIQKGFCVTVAYTVEYAEWVEMERGTTGYLKTLHNARKEFQRSFKLLKAA